MQQPFDADLHIVAQSAIDPQLLAALTMTQDLNIIQDLDDEPNDVGGLTADELKAKFDEAGLTIQRYLNETLIPQILAQDATEKARIAAETARQAAEADRVTAETGRVQAETQRRANEAQRLQAEEDREANEADREQAEEDREDRAAEVNAQLLETAQQVATHLPRIGSSGNWQVWDYLAEAYWDTGVPATGARGEVGPVGPPGIQGPPGPQGIHGLAVEAQGQWAFNVNDQGHLVVYYTDQAPDLSIDGRGHLILNLE